jgi:hypothetical protein
MENKLLTYILQMQKQSSTQSVPKLPKAQKGKTVFSLKDYASNINTISNDNISRKPAYVKDYEQKEAFDKQQKERQLKELQDRDFNNRSYISQDRSTPASRAADKQRAIDNYVAEAQRNSPLAQTFGSMTPSGYNPGAGSVAASQFVKTMPIIAAGAAGATALPSIMAGLNAPIAGVAGLTGTNVMNAGFAYQAAKNLPNVGRSIKTAYQNPTLSNIGDATAQTALTTLDALPFASSVAPGVKAAVKASKESGLLSNAYKVNPFAFKPNSDAAYRMIGNEGYADALTSGVIRPPKGSGHTEAYYNKGYPLDTKLRDATGRAGYEGPYMAEVKGNRDLFVDENVASYTGPMFDDPVLYSKQNIPIDNQGVKFYKENWLQGYKEVPRQRVPNRSSLKSYNPNRQDPVSQTVYNPETGTSVNYDVDGNVIGNSKKLTTNEIKAINQGIETRPVTTGATPPPPEGMAPYLVTDTDAIMSKNAQWLESPQYLKRRMEATGETAVQVKADVAKILAEGEKTKFAVKPYSNTNVEGYYSKPKKYDWFERKVLGKKDIPAEISIKEGLPFESHMGALDHEVKHAMSQFATNNNYKGYPTIKVGNWFERNINGLGTHADYLNKAPEQQVRYLKILEDIEKSKGIPKGDIITPEQFDDWIDTRYNPYYSKGFADDVVDLVDHIAKRYGKNTRKVLLDKLNKAYVIPGAVGAAGVLGAQQKAQGGPIVDPRGQWAHPGKVTRIPGSDITMQGVNYPVLGVGSNGKKQMMYPGKDYSFGGAEHVDEYPMMQNGGYTLPEVTVYGHRNPTAKAYFDRWRKETEDWQDRESPVNSPMSYYLAGEQMYNKYKGHDIEMLDKQDRPMLRVTPFSDTLQIHNPESDYRGDSLISELAHKVQLNKKGNLGFIKSHIGNDYLNTLKNMSLSDIFNADSWKSAYDKNYYAPGTQEYEAHSIIEPKLREEFQILADKEYDKLTAGKMKNGGYTVTRSNDRKGKTHKVTGPGGVVKYFGDSKLGQHPKDPERKKAFYARHKSNLAGNPFFRAFARKTWEDGGQTDDDKEMLSGVADILRRINDTNNRKQIANYMMDNFRDEDVTFEPNKFLRSANAFGNNTPKAQTGREVKKKYVMPQSSIDFNNRLTAQDEATKKLNLYTMRQYYINSGQPYFTENKSPREKVEPWTDPVLDRIDRENNEKYEDRDGGFENFLEFIDPTGISSWDDVGRTFRNPSASNIEKGFALFSALPYIGKLGKLAKGTKAVNTAVKANALQKIGRGALKGVDIVTGGPAMRYFDQTLNPLSRGFGTLTEKAVGQIPYSGVRKAFEIGSDFNQMRRFQDGVLSPGYNYLDKYMTQPANPPKQK